MTTLNVPGKEPVEAFSTEQVKEMCASNDTQIRKAIVEHLKALGYPVTEVVRMKPDEREKAILAKYEELGGKKATGGAKATVAKAGAGKTAAAGAAKATTKKVEPESEVEQDAGSVDLTPLLSEISELKEQVGSLAELVTVQASFVNECHFILRAMLGLNGQEDDAKELAEGYMGNLLLEDAAEGNE
jgi:hypothetical protein